MAKLSWGKVYYKGVPAGFIREEPGGSISFTYHDQYIEEEGSAIAHTLPVCSEPHISHNHLHPFFDNLVAEGWLEKAQNRLIGRHEASRFDLLLIFGIDCIGAVSIINPESSDLVQEMLNIDDPKEVALIENRASLSGVMPKLTLIEENDLLRQSRHTELSTHIAKFSSPSHPGLIENEYVTSLAFKALLPNDEIVHPEIMQIKGIEEPALVIKRFDRKQGQTIPFEEFNQLLGKKSTAKYEGAYEDMAHFINNTEGCLPTETYLLYRRILAGVILGNTDMHLKNFAMFHTEDGLRLTPSYDQVATSIYDYKTLALSMLGAKDHPLADLKERHIVLLGRAFELSNPAIEMAVKEFEKNIDKAKDVINEAKFGSADFKNNLIKLMEKRWNGTFRSIGDYLSKKL